MEKTDKQKQQLELAKLISLTFVKSLIIMVSAMFLVIAVCYTLAPSAAIKIYEGLGSKTGVVGVYERIYTESGKNTDLYNLIQKSIAANLDKKTDKYIGQLRDKRDYREFVQKLDEAVIKASKLKYVAYVGDLDGYLVSQQVKALYDMGKKKQAEELAIADLENTNVKSFALSTYLECVMVDKSLASDRVEKLEELVSQQVSGQSLMEKVDARVAAADYTQMLAPSEKILLVYTCLKIQNFKYSVYTMLGNETLSGIALGEMEALQDIYETLIIE